MLSRKFVHGASLVASLAFAGCSGSTPTLAGTPRATPTAAPSASPTPAPSATPSAPTPTPGAVTFSPAAVSAVNLVPAPGAGAPADCPAGTPADTTCFSGDPTEVDPSQIGYAGSFSATPANPSIALAPNCTASTSCKSPNGILVYPQGAGTTTVAVTGAAGIAGTLPVTVTETNLSIGLQNLPTAQMVDVSYELANGARGSAETYNSITGTNPTLTFYNFPAPVDESYTFFRILVYDGSENEIGQSTLRGFTIPSGQVNTESFTVSPSTT